MKNKKYYSENGNLFIRKDILNRAMRELDEEEFNVWFKNILEEVRRESDEYEPRT